MAPKKKEVKSNPKDDRLKAIEDRVTALENITSKFISIEEDLDNAGKVYDNLKEWKEEMSGIIQRLKTRMGL
jgi:hypothetical protein